MNDLLSISPETAALTENVNLVSFKTSEGVELRATPLRLLPQSVTFEIYNPLTAPRVSELLADFKILAGDRPVYSDKATVSSVVSHGSITVCAVALQGSWLDVNLFASGDPGKNLAPAFSALVNRWEKFHQILPEYKLAVADIQSFFQELRLWLDQVELGIRGLPAGERAQTEKSVVLKIAKLAEPVFANLFERFEIVAATVPPELIAIHGTFCRRQLHPFLMASPFMHRITAKPLGYAGDYEMVNMILRDSCEGGSLFAKLLNVFILAAPPAEAHRNRVKYLVKRLTEETCRMMSQRRVCRIYNLGCGPAGEIQHFIAHHEFSDWASFTLLDADDETLAYTGGLLEKIKRKHQRRTPVRLIKKSVHNLLRPSGKSTKPDDQYDFIYSAGLFDYLNDRAGRTVIEIAYEQLAPGGLLLITNVEALNPIRNIMEHFYEWYLIYRSGVQLGALADGLPSDAEVAVRADITSVNIFLEVRKPLSPP